MYLTPYLSTQRRGKGTPKKCKVPEAWGRHESSGKWLHKVVDEFLCSHPSCAQTGLIWISLNPETWISSYTTTHILRITTWGCRHGQTTHFYWVPTMFQACFRCWEYNSEKSLPISLPLGAFILVGRDRTKQTDNVQSFEISGLCRKFWG